MLLLVAMLLLVDVAAGVIAVGCSDALTLKVRIVNLAFRASATVLLNWNTEHRVSDPSTLSTTLRPFGKLRAG
jgi:hypothetical protein